MLKKNRHSAPGSGVRAIGAAAFISPGKRGGVFLFSCPEMGWQRSYIPQTNADPLITATAALQQRYEKKCFAGAVVFSRRMSIKQIGGSYFPFQFQPASSAAVRAA
jgi:hypothetical protein